jgi:hypothetical protein
MFAVSVGLLLSNASFDSSDGFFNASQIQSLVTSPCLAVTAEASVAPIDIYGVSLNTMGPLITFDPVSTSTLTMAITSAVQKASIQYDFQISSSK